MFENLMPHVFGPL